MITLAVSNGGSDYVELTLEDNNGEDLSTSDIRLTLVPIDGSPPDRDSDQWQTPSVKEFPEDGTAEVSLFVDESTFPLGQYWAWALVNDIPTRVFVRARNEIIRLI